MVVMIFESLLCPVVIISFEDQLSYIYSHEKFVVMKLKI